MLLDPERRAAYDAELGGPEPRRRAPTEPPPTTPPSRRAAVTDDAGAASRTSGGRATPKAARSLPTVPGWLLIALTVAVLAVASVAGYLQFAGADDEKVETAVDEATAAAADHGAAGAQLRLQERRGGPRPGAQVLTGDLKTDYAELWRRR